MGPLKLQLQGTHSSVYNYAGYSNLLRMDMMNQQAFKQRSDDTTYFLPNEHVLVQLLSFMDINPQWDFEYLCNIIDLRKERWASQFNLTCVANKGEGTRNVFYYNGFYEHLIIAPNQLTYKEYLNMPEVLLTPIIPIYSTDTHWDFLHVRDRLMIKNIQPLGYAVIAIDFGALAIGYWRWQRDCLKHNELVNYSPNHYLTSYPLNNAVLLQNRLSVINVLYEHAFNDKPLKDALKQRKAPQVTYDNSREQNRFLTFLDDLFSIKPLRYQEQLYQHIKPTDQLPIDNRTLTPGRYDMYTQTSWVWQLPLLKLYPLIMYYNAKTFNKDGHLSATVKRWSEYGLNIWLRNIKNDYFRNHFQQMAERLIDVNEH